jgi:hypothetical protein
LHLMLWMASEVNERKKIAADYFVDVGANIGQHAQRFIVAAYDLTYRCIVL